MPLANEQEAQEYATKEAARILGQIRTHLAAHAVPTLLASVDVNKDEAVVMVLNRLAAYVVNGK